MAYKKVYSHLVDRIEEIVCELLKEGEDYKSIHTCIALIKAVDECEKIFCEETKSVEKIHEFPRKSNSLYRKMRDSYKEVMRKKGYFSL